MITDPFGAVVEDAIPATPNVFEIDGSYVGQVLTVKVNDVVNNNSCWGTLTLEDKLGSRLMNLLGHRLYLFIDSIESLSCWFIREPFNPVKLIGAGSEFAYKLEEMLVLHY